MTDWVSRRAGGAARPLEGEHPVGFPPSHIPSPHAQAGAPSFDAVLVLSTLDDLRGDRDGRGDLNSHDFYLAGYWSHSRRPTLRLLRLGHMDSPPKHGRHVAGTRGPDTYAQRRTWVLWDRHRRGQVRRELRRPSQRGRDRLLQQRARSAPSRGALSQLSRTSSEPGRSLLQRMRCGTPPRRFATPLSVDEHLAVFASTCLSPGESAAPGVMPRLIERVLPKV